MSYGWFNYWVDYNCCKKTKAIDCCTRANNFINSRLATVQEVHSLLFDNQGSNIDNPDYHLVFLDFLLASKLYKDTVEYADVIQQSFHDPDHKVALSLDVTRLNAYEKLNDHESRNRVLDRIPHLIELRRPTRSSRTGGLTGRSKFERAILDNLRVHDADVKASDVSKLLSDAAVMREITEVLTKKLTGQ
jgi:hypothetical protein